MKNKTTRFLAAFALLLCFTTGQIIVFTHSHVVSYSKHTPSKQNANAGTDESCKICHVSHEATAILNSDLHNAVIYGTAYKQLQAASLSYQSISLVLAATRGPPLV